jgi:hypothetical protein
MSSKEYKTEEKKDNFLPKLHNAIFGEFSLSNEQNNLNERNNSSKEKDIINKNNLKNEK